jgi:hypothetical protein
MAVEVDDDLLLVPSVVASVALAMSDLNVAPPVVRLLLLLWLLVPAVLGELVVVPELPVLRAGWIAVGDVTANPAIFVRGLYLLVR